MARTTKTLTVSLSPKTFAELERLAAEEGKSKSQLVREMFEAYRERKLDETWEELREYGRATAERFGLESEDDLLRLVNEGRGADYRP